MKIFDVLLKKYRSNKITSANHVADMNIVLHDHKAIYFFIPKVACTSIKKVCAEALHLLTKSTGAKAIHFSVPYPSIPRNELSCYAHYFKFAFVRNPWDRLVSCYVNKISKDPSFNSIAFQNGIFKPWIKYGKFKAGMSFDEFVRVVEKITDSDAESHFRSQCTFITNIGGNLIVDFIGRFENLEKDFEQVSRRIGLPECRLEKLMTSSRRSDYREYYDEETKRIVAERYEKDIKMFNYNFE